MNSFSEYDIMSGGGSMFCTPLKVYLCVSCMVAMLLSIYTIVYKVHDSPTFQTYLAILITDLILLSITASIIMYMCSKNVQCTQNNVYILTSVCCIMGILFSIMFFAIP